MEVNCLEKPAKFKNLTRNKNYEAIEDGEAYVVTNDIGFRARYAKKYFRVVPEAPVTRRLLDLLTVTIEDEDVRIVLNRTTREVSLSVDATEISCGIDQISGISNLKSTVNSMYAAKAADIEGTKTEMFATIMNVILEELRRDNKMCWLVSDQVRDSDIELDAYLTSIAVSAITGNNPNSGNDITLWVIQ
jgi:MoaA/NifB/PqqE/SkfB family radical SAM enzyme